MPFHSFPFLYIVLAVVLYWSPVSAQQNDITNKVNTVNTAVPFLRIVPDARSAAMGDAGVAVSPDAYANYHNPSKLAFTQKQLGMAVSYNHWLSTASNHVFLASYAGYYRFDDIQAIGLSARYFSLGEFNSSQGGLAQSYEYAIDASYSRKLSKHFSIGLTMRFIYSNLATGQSVSGVTIQPDIAGAGDVSFYYHKDVSKLIDFSAGLNISNLGNKISYTQFVIKDFLPANFGFGTNVALNFHKNHEVSFTVDANKLLAPTPNITDADNNGVLDYREKSVPAGVLGSFSDAPGGFGEEMREFNFSLGTEYWYNDLFALRAGYFWEHLTKGAREFFSAGLGVKYSALGLDFSYLVPLSNQLNPLDNTFRLTLNLDFDVRSSTENNGDAQM